MSDLKNEIEEISDDEIEIEKPDKIVDIVEKILQFNRQNQEGQGLNPIVPGIFLSDHAWEGAPSGGGGGVHGGGQQAPPPPPTPLSKILIGKWFWDEIWHSHTLFQKSGGNIFSKFQL